MKCLLGLFCTAVFLFAFQSEHIAANDELGSENRLLQKKPSLHVITSGVFAAAYNSLVEQIESDLGVSLNTEYGSSLGGAIDSIPVRLERGEQFDVIILGRRSLDQLTEKGYVMPESRVDLAHSVIGMAVKEGAKVPDISTTEKFVQVLLDAKSIGYSASGSGTYLSTVLFPKMGLWEAVEPKSTRVLSERVASVVARGEVEIGFQQVSEILPIEGARFAGQIPDELQMIATASAGILRTTTKLTDSQRLLDYLSSVKLVEQIKATGLSPVAVERLRNDEVGASF